ncbi:TerB family tellurite resistance protein [Aquimarina latercula]|uniref:tellurite resistance TerB family protein n=1 Tax=Aquimarina latercula TaxID=987 RepID=UPI000487074E|nr:TerB family tellurite resistance protein [Aquimarina latercula]
MPILDLYESKEHSTNFAHFAAVVYLAHADGNITSKEIELLKGLAQKLKIEEKEYQMTIENPTRYPISSTTSTVKRLQRLYDMFRIIFTDDEIEDEELMLVYSYAIELGFPAHYAKKVVDRSVAMFNREFDFNDWSTFVTK